jgi:hypothetical protein
LPVANIEIKIVESQHLKQASTRSLDMFVFFPVPTNTIESILKKIEASAFASEADTQVTEVVQEYIKTSNPTPDPTPVPTKIPTKVPTHCATHCVAHCVAHYVAHYVAYYVAHCVAHYVAHCVAIARHKVMHALAKPAVYTVGESSIDSVVSKQSKCKR